MRDLADQCATKDPDLTVDQARADALVDLLLTNVTVTASVTLSRELVDPLGPEARVRVGWPALLRRRERRGTRHPGSPARGTHDGGDAFELDLRTDERLAALYLDAEQHDGYQRDRDVFSAGITIEDNLALVVDYASGATLSYSLNAHSPWEGYRVAVNGTLGRAELEVVERGAVLAGGGLHPVLDPSAVDAGASASLRPEGERLIVQKHWEAPYEVLIESSGDGHGGGDVLLLADVFEGPGEDPLARPADWRDGIRSIAVGIAGNLSLETGLPVRIDELGIRFLSAGATATDAS